MPSRGARKKKIQIIPEYDWPFEISFKLNRNPPKVAFLSGVPREFYPEDPGISKFGLTYCIPVPDYEARPNFVPSSNLLQKPISLKGYGIGGLSAPRFATLEHEDTPAPNVYQSELVPAPVKRAEKAKRAKWNDFVEKYEKIVEKQFLEYELNKKEHGGGGVGHTASQSISMKTRKSTKTGIEPRKPNFPGTPKHELLKCPTKHSAFGMSFSNSRFKYIDQDEKIGVGTYDVNTPALKTSFQITTAEGKLEPRVRIVCHPRGCDLCMVCSAELDKSDYYQTIRKFKVANHVDPDTEGKFKMRNLSLCRACYCHALKHGCHQWSKEKIPDTFMKARHCNTVHDHKEGHTEFLMRTTCKKMMNLARRELIYSRYFRDNPCEKKR